MIRKVLITSGDIDRELSDFNWSVIALDTETTSLKYMDLQVEGVSLCDGKKTVYVPCSDLDWLFPYKHKIKVLIAHNIVFDLKVLYKYGIKLNCELFDTMIADHLINENKRHGLKLLSKELLGESPISYEEAAKHGTDSKEFFNYAMNDAEWTYKIALLHKQELRKQNMMKLFRDIEMPFQYVLLDMEINGISIDIQKVKEYTKQLEDLCLQLELQMLDSLNIKYDFQTDLITGALRPMHNVNFNSNKQLADILFNKLGLPILEETPTGQPKVGKSTINIYKLKYPFVELLAKYKVARKFLTSFFLPLPQFIDKDGRVRPGFRDHGTVTGRLSSQRPNIQQLPNYNKDVPINARECFIVPKGKKMVAVDYSQQELRVMAHLSLDPTLIKIINEGGDLHLINANTVFDLGISEEKMYKSHPDYKDTKAKFKKQRSDGKVFSFGIPYGMGEHKLSRDFKVSEDQAKILLDKFFKGFPQLKEAIDNCHKEAEDNLSVTTLYGRKRHFEYNEWNKLDNKSLRQSFNFLIQSVGADMIRESMIRVRNYGKKNLYLGLKILFTVHDEIVMECNEQYAEEVTHKVEKIMESVTPKDFAVQLVAEGSTGNDYSEAK